MENETMQGMDGMTQGVSVFDTFQALFFSDAVGIAIGIISIILLWKTTRKLGGRIRKPLMLLIMGLSLMTISFAVTIGIVAVGAMTPGTMAFHHIIMVFGMILFVFAGRAFVVFTKV